MKNYEKFQKQVEKWYSKLGLQAWDISVYDAEEEDWYARTTISVDAMTASIEYGISDQDNDDINDTALHEVLEVAISPLRGLINQPPITEREIEKEAHRLIHSLIKVIISQEKANVQQTASGNKRRTGKKEK